MRKLKQAGDTIVEVLVALAVSSLVMGSAIASANQSLRGSQRAQERSEAQKIAEAQLEQLRYKGYKGVGVATSFHFNSVWVQTSGPGSISGVGIPYTVDITRSSPTDHNFTINVTWSPSGGSGSNDVVTIKYAVY